MPLPSLPPGASTTAAYPLPTDRRGVYPVGPLAIGHTDPLRLMRLGGDYASTTVLQVHPRVHVVAPLPTGRSRDMDGPTSSSAPRGGVAFHSLREYEPGDDPRLVHAKSSARTGTLMVRHNVVPNEPRMMVVLDTSAAPYACRRPVDAGFEDAVRVAASLAVSAVDHGFPLDLRTTAGALVRTDRAFRRTALLDLLAGVACARRRPRAGGAAGHGAPRRGRVARRRHRPPGPGAARVRRPRPAPVPDGSLVHVGPQCRPRPEPPRGALVLDVATGADFAAAWNRRVRR